MSETFNWCLDKTKLAIWDKQVFCIDEYVDRTWYLNGLLHRENGPSVEYANGDKCWWLNGKLHREDGPAIELASGYKAWWLNGKEYSESAYWKEINK